MIDWDIITIDLTKEMLNLIDSDFEPDNPYNEANYIARNIIKYFKSLISKEFKLMVKGKNDGIYQVNMKDEIVVTICIKEPVKRLMKELIEFDNKNISIYISENKEE